ncbi:uncharacterized protein LOC129941826 [Eupeodes corollae]|uniref:uncharacterized protein LOC129941826 n=1 Tax=Eupeodes corollae TaxID=290404 RepID=UPI0024904D70|nr:uncharacterized protein LOC129941826 [Eupeodes corollae]
MKVVLWSLFVTFICSLFLFEEVSSLGTTIVDDILIERQNDGLLYCDSLICPNGTAQCHVTKRINPNDFNYIIRQRKCIAENGAILEEQKINERNKFLGNVNVNVLSSGGVSSTFGTPLTPQEQKELNDFLQKTQENVQSQVNGALNQVQSSLGNLFGGSFLPNFQNIFKI